MSETPTSYQFEHLPTDDLPSADELGDLHAQLGLDPDTTDYQVREPADSPLMSSASNIGRDSKPDFSSL